MFPVISDAHPPPFENAAWLCERLRSVRSRVHGGSVADYVSMFPVISDADPPPFESQLTAWLCERLRFCEIQGPMGGRGSRLCFHFPRNFGRPSPSL